MPRTRTASSASAILVPRPGHRIVTRRDGRIQRGLDPDRREIARDYASLSPQALTDQSTVHLTSHDPLRTGLLATHGGDYEHRRAQRGLARLGLEGHPAWTDPLRELLENAGCERFVGKDEAAEVRLVIADGEVDRDRVDSLMADDEVHLPVSVVDGGVRWGPLVVPGVSCCLRCVDAHCCDRDPAWPLLVAQYSPMGVRPAIDPAEAAVAVALLARETVAYLDGDRPLCWGATVRLVAGQPPQVEPWCRHPACGCSWQA